MNKRGIAPRPFSRDHRAVYRIVNYQVAPRTPLQHRGATSTTLIRLDKYPHLMRGCHVLPPIWTHDNATTHAHSVHTPPKPQPAASAISSSPILPTSAASPAPSATRRPKSVAASTLSCERWRQCCAGAPSPPACVGAAWSRPHALHMEVVVCGWGLCELARAEAAQERPPSGNACSAPGSFAAFAT